MSHTVGAARRADTGLVLQPFRGVRYDPRTLDVGAVTCPPYDVIGPAEAERLAASEPHNLVHVTLAAASAAPELRYAEAGARWRQWQASGVLRSDAAPALYVYEARHGERRQLGLVGAVGLRAPEDGVILPHEDVHPGPVADRLAQMQATDANLEPIFLVVPGFGAAGDVIARTTATAPLLDITMGTGGTGTSNAASVSNAPGAAGAPGTTATSDTAGTSNAADTSDTATEASTTATHDTAGASGTRGTYRLWAITDPDDLATVAAALRDRQALIADGHHRYTAYRQLQAARHAAGLGAGPWDYGLAFLVDSDSHPPTLQPIHRVAPGLPPASVLAALPPGLDVLDLGEHLGPALARLEAAARHPNPDAHATPSAGADPGTHEPGAGAGHPLLLAGDGRYRLVTLPPAPAADRTPVPGTSADRTADGATADGAAGRAHSAAWHELDVTALHRWLADVLQVPDERLRFVHSATVAVAMAAQTGGTAFLLNPPSVAAVHAIAAAGDRMPRKSTSFGPKPLGGLVLRSLSS